MSDKPWKATSAQADTDDARLGERLRNWRSIEPQADFETAVWRRIHTVSAPERPRLPLVTTLREWLGPRPAWARAMAAAAGIAVGVGLAFYTPGARAGRHVDEPLRHARTLTGAYLTMVAGGTR